MINSLRLLLALNLLASVHALAANFNCDEMLAPPAREMLQELNAGNYDVRVFSTKVHGQTKLIVLVGESSVKSPDSRRLTKNLDPYFRWRGYETPESSPTWGAKLDERLLQPLRTRFGVPDAFERIIRQKIDKARVQGAAEYSLADLERVLEIHQTQKFARKKLKELEAWPPATLDDVIRPGTLAPTRRAQVEFLRAYSQPFHDPDELDLSQGHVPQIWENLHSVSSLSVMGVYFAAELLT